LSFRGRRRLPGSTLLAALGILALTVVGTVPALAAEPIPVPAVAAVAAQPQPIPEPREQKPGETSGFRLPFAAGPEVRIEQGWNTTFSHKGKAAYAYDFGLYMGTNVLAAAAGVVSYVHDGETRCGGPELRKNANYVTINHADGSATQYGHLSKVGVKIGDVVAAGEVIGKSGDTGYTQCLPHLHFARQYQGGGVTKSVPVYFDGYAKKEFHTGDLVVAQATACPVSSDPAAATGVPLGTFCATYSAKNPDYPTSFARRDAVLSFDWRSKGPGGYWLDSPRTAFSAHWNGDVAFPSAGTYTIAVVWTGVVVVSIDGVPVVDASTDQADPVETVILQSLGGGIHRIDVQYTAPTGHGALKLGWGRLFVDE
jgi:murein DD-endopeptidase MepM/ murein hydrolase activator NlpD